MKTVRRILCLGIGGTGTRIAAKCVRSLMGHYPDSYHLFSRLVTLDRILEHEPEILSPYFLPLNLKRAEAVIRCPSEFPEFASWLRIEAIKEFVKAPGTGEDIAAGALMFAATLPTFIHRVRKELGSLLDPKLSAYLRERGLLLAENPIYIFIVRSIGGGTGGGALSYVDWAVKSVIERLKLEEVYITDIMVSPEAYIELIPVKDPDQKEKMRAIAFSVISHIHHYSSVTESKAFVYGRGKDDFFPIGGRKPVGHFLLIEHRNPYLHLRTLDDLFELVSRYVLAHSLEKWPVEFDAAYANVREEREAPYKGQNPLFSSIGLYEKRFPYEILKDFYANELKLGVLDYLLEGDRR